MKTKILGLLAVGLLAGPVTASAVNITYSVNRTVGSATITGSIITDGTLGLIGRSNIVGFSLTGTFNEPSALVTPLGTMGVISTPYAFFADFENTFLRATATELYVDTSTSINNGFFMFYGQIEDPYGGGHETYLEYSFTLSTIEGILDEAIWLHHYEGETSDCIPCGIRSLLPVQRLVVGTAPGTPSVPEPGTLALLGLGLAGLGLSRRRKAN